MTYIGTDRRLHGSDYPFTPHKVILILAESTADEIEIPWGGEREESGASWDCKTVTGEIRRAVKLRKSESYVDLPNL